MEAIFSKVVGSMEECFAGEENTIELRERVLDLLPIEDRSCKIVNVSGTVQRFKARVIAYIENEEAFIKDYCNQNNETLRIHTSNKKSRYYRYKNKSRNEKTKEVGTYLSLYD